MSEAHRERTGNGSDTNNNSSRSESLPAPAHGLSCAFMSCTLGVDEETAIGRRPGDNADSPMAKDFTVCKALQSCAPCRQILL